MTNPNFNAENNGTDILRLYGALIGGMNELWFKAVEEAFGQSEAIGLEAKVWEGYLRMFVKRTRQLVSSGGSAVEEISELIQLDPFFLSGDYQISHLSKNRMFLRINKCLLFEAMTGAGRPAHLCEMAEGLHFRRLAKEVDPRVVAHAIKLPPRNSPDEAYCEWLLEVRDA